MTAIDLVLPPVLSLRRLVASELEAALRTVQQNPEGTSDRPPSALAALHIDLSQINWVDIVAAAQLLILIDGWARNAVQVTVYLPDPDHARQDDSEGDPNKRQSAARFLRYIQFERALAHIAERRGDTVTAKTSFLPAARDVAAYEYPESYRRIVPLRWVALSDLQTRQQLAKKFVDALRNCGEGVDGPDAQAISNVVLFELIENVVEHSRAGDAALVCGFAHVNAARGPSADYLPEELPYVAAAYDAQQPILEIAIGDSGRGIVSTLEESYRSGPGKIRKNLTRTGRALPHNIIRWAFDRWSTEKEVAARQRGVRGLFRVDRLVAKYFGQVVVRSGRTVFVREHLVRASPVERYNKAPHRYGEQFGTVIRVRMTGFTVPGIAELISEGRRGEQATKNPGLVEEEPPRTVVLEELLEVGLTQDVEAQIAECLSNTQRRPSSLYVLVAATAASTRATERALRFLCAHASPIPIYALNISCSLDELDGVVSSINAECDGISPVVDVTATSAEKLDLVLAAHASGAIRWLGLPTAIAELVQDIGPGEVVDIPQHLYASVLKIEARLKTFFSVEQGGSSVPFRQLKCLADLSQFRSWAVSNMVSKLRDTSQSNQNAIWNNGPYLTPTLNFVHRWLRIDLLMSQQSKGHFEGLAFEFARALRSSFNRSTVDRSDRTRGVFLAMEERSSKQMRDALAVRFGFRTLANPTDGRSDLMSLEPMGQPVIVYADLVSSGESLRRATQTVLRRGFSVAAVVALVDTRHSTTDHIIAFGRKIPLIALIHEPNEASEPEKFAVVAPSLLFPELQSTTSQSLLALSQFDRKADQFIWKALDFRHQIRASGRHLTLTLQPRKLLASMAFSEKLQTCIETSSLYHASNGQSGPIAVLCPLDEQDDNWRDSVLDAMARLRLKTPPVVHFITRTTLGKNQALDTVESIFAKLKKASLVIIFDWGVITGRTIDALTTAALDAGAKRILAIAANSQLSTQEAYFRHSVRTLGTEIEVPSELDLIEPAKKTTVTVDYLFIRLSSLPLGQYWASDCPVCIQADEILSLSCPDLFLANYRDAALRNLQTPSEPDSQDSVTPVINEFIAALRSLLVAAQSQSAPRFALKLRLQELVRQLEATSEVLPVHTALIELLYVEGVWIQLPPIRYRVCRDPVSSICIHLIKRGTPDLRAKAISVLRRISKKVFISRAPELFGYLGKQPKALGALLFGIHTFLARRYHETVDMLQPVSVALQELRIKIQEDGNLTSPAFSSAYPTVQYLSFQTEFLSSRARSRNLNQVAALVQLRDLLSEPNYYAHGVQNQAIERLLAVQFLDAIRSWISAELSGGEEGEPLPRHLNSLLQLRLLAWNDVHEFITTKVVPLASAARKAFESRQFRELLCRDETRTDDAQWFLNLLDLHSHGLAPELVPGQLLNQLNIRRDVDSTRLPAVKVLELLDASHVELSRLLNIILRAKQHAQLNDPTRPAVGSSRMKEFLDSLVSNVQEALLYAVNELKVTHGRGAPIEFTQNSRTDDFIVCCPRQLLREAMLELLNNVGKHGGGAMVADQFDAHIRCDLEEDVVVVSVSNARKGKSSALVDPQRHGLALFKKELASFEALLEVTESDSRFVVRLILRRWR